MSTIVKTRILLSRNANFLQNYISGTATKSIASLTPISIKIRDGYIFKVLWPVMQLQIINLTDSIRGGSWTIRYFINQNKLKVCFSLYCMHMSTKGNGNGSHFFSNLRIKYLQTHRHKKGEFNFYIWCE